MDRFCLFMLTLWLLSGVVLTVCLWRDVYAPRRALAKAFPPHLQDLTDRASTQTDQWDEWNQEASTSLLDEIERETMLALPVNAPIAPADSVERLWIEAGYKMALQELGEGLDHPTVKRLLSEVVTTKAGMQTREAMIESFAIWLDERGKELRSHMLTDAAREWRDENQPL